MRKRLGVVFGGCVAAASPGFGQVDHLTIVVERTLASGTSSLAATAYNPTTDTVFTATFGAGGAVRAITDVGGTPVSTVRVSESQLQQFYRDGNPDRGVLTPLISGMVLNPLPVGSFPAYSFAIITDSGTTRLPGSTATDPAATKRVYRYNLGAVAAGGDGRDVFTSLVTLADMGALQGSPTSTSSNAGRQGAFSSDGRAFYFVDSSAAYGGVYRTDVLSGATSLVLDTAGDVNTEPGVLPRSGGGDRVLVQGSAGNNLGGLNVIDVDAAGAGGGSQALISAATLADFLQRPVGAADLRSVTTDAAGNVYFFDTDSKVLVRRDARGRLSKVLTNAERAAFRDQAGKTGTVNGNVLRLQARTANHPTAGAVTQVMFAEQTAQNYVAGVYAFEAGDFDRNGRRDEADVALFKPVLTTRGVVQTNSGNFKFDVNGNAVVDWRDVRALQPFFDFGDADADLNGLVDFADFLTLRENFGRTGRRFTEADFDGDDDVDLADFAILQNSFGYRSGVLGLGLTPAPFDQGAWDQFVASVPEPAGVGVLGAVATGLLARRRRGAK